MAERQAQSTNEQLSGRILHEITDFQPYLAGLSDPSRKCLSDHALHQASQALGSRLNYLFGVGRSGVGLSSVGHSSDGLSVVARPGRHHRLAFSRKGDGPDDKVEEEEGEEMEEEDGDGEADLAEDLDEEDKVGA